ncbi:hypothetical protein [Kocuria rosea]|uniref:NERD domain-containing protein n=1 Tax=Kocuria rosea TaxID=1275 RepID=A0A4V3B3X2_KOCRO|nr:hypothetical protein [Kocuria rosea]TDL46493.1 hypothetical protein E2R59_00255 [Kocuria rosea]
MRDAQYVAVVRRHSPSVLVPAVAALSARFKPGEWRTTVSGVTVTPWALADIARTSLVHGNEHRRKDLQPRHLLECVQAYNDLDDPNLSADKPRAASEFFLRVAAEQLDYQLPPQATMARTAALLEQTTPSRPLKTIRPGWDRDLLECTLSEYVGVGFLLHVSCPINDGRFDPRWMTEIHKEAIREYILPDVIDLVTNTQYATEVTSFQEDNARFYHHGAYRRFSYNPLASRPAIRGLAPELVIPVPQTLIRKISPLGIYYQGVDRWGNSFAEDLGELFEQYVGRQLRLLPNAMIHPETTYGPKNKKSVDWIVVLDEAVILVEVKSVRPTDPVRMGSPDASAALQRMLGWAFDQLNTTDTLLEAGQPELNHVPKDRPRFGLVVTMEDFHVINSPLHRHWYRNEEGIPSLVVSITELEWMVTIQQPVDRFIMGLLTDPAKTGWSVRSQFGKVKHSRNAVIEKAWKSYPFSRLKRNRKLEAT